MKDKCTRAGSWVHAVGGASVGHVTRVKGRSLFIVRDISTVYKVLIYFHQIMNFYNIKNYNKGNYRNERRGEVLLWQRSNSVFCSFDLVFFARGFRPRCTCPRALENVCLVGRSLLFRGRLESRLSLGDVDLDAFGALGGGVLPFGNRSFGRHQSFSGLLTLLVAALLLPPRGLDLYRLLWCVGRSGLLLLGTSIDMLNITLINKIEMHIY